MFSQHAASQEKKVIFFGDSLTAGLGLPSQDAYPELVRQLAQKEGVQLKVINAGVSGETSAGGLRRVDWAIKDGADLFFLALGANDGLRGQPAANLKANLKAIIKKVKTALPHCSIVLAGMYALPNLGEEYANAYKEAYSSLAQEEKITLMPFLLEGVAGIPALNQPDGLHPSEKGQEIMAKAVWDLLKAELSVRENHARDQHPASVNGSLQQ